MLPRLPYKGRRLAREIVDFRGLDRTEGAPEGAGVGPRGQGPHFFDTFS